MPSTLLDPRIDYFFAQPPEPHKIPVAHLRDQKTAGGRAVAQSLGTYLRILP